jgi:hypothetical protein
MFGLPFMAVRLVVSNSSPMMDCTATWLEKEGARMASSTSSNHHSWRSLLRRADRLRRQLGLRWHRQIVLLRGPVRVVLHLSRCPSLSCRTGRFGVNISAREVRLNVRVARGLAYRTRVFRWPWARRSAPRTA